MAYPQIIHNGVLREMTAAEKTQYDADQATYQAALVPDALANKRRELNANCDAAITAGFTSSALGTPHTYPSSEEDQLNLLGLVTAGVDHWFDADDGTGEAQKLHTAAQLQQVFSDGLTYKGTVLQQCKTLKAQAQAVADGAGTIEEKLAAIEAIVWS